MRKGIELIRMCFCKLFVYTITKHRKGKKEMKKAISILLGIVLLAGLVACGAKSDLQESGPEENQAPIIENNVTDSEDMMEIDSPIGTLYYPVKWKNDVTFQVTDDRVVALHYDDPLFTLYFGGDKGDLFGTVKQQDGTEIALRYEMHDLDSSHEDYETMSAMQEDINVIFQYLMQEGKLVEAG